MKRVAFCGGLIFNSNSETFVQANILCEDGYIKDITRGSVPYDYEIISVEGKYVIPGLVDVHTHGIAGFDFNYASDKDHFDSISFAFGNNDLVDAYGGK